MAWLTASGKNADRVSGKGVNDHHTHSAAGGVDRVGT
jgi:hypothetical protein